MNITFTFLESLRSETSPESAENAAVGTQTYQRCRSEETQTRLYFGFYIYTYVYMYIYALREDLRKVRSSKKTMTFADKTSIMYRLEKEEYHHLLQNAVTTTYKKFNKETERKINCEGIKYAKEANILDKVELNGTANCFITLKDHKANFLNHPTTRLINRKNK